MESAASLFSKGGYAGASTRDIARAANLNEATIFRHFPRKHDLYMAVLESGLQGVRLRGDLLAELAGASDAHAALANTFELIAATLAEPQDLIRLLQFGFLDLGKEFEPLLRKHLRELIEVVAGYLQPWIDRGELRCANAKTVVLTCIAIALSYHTLSRVFSKDMFGVGTTIDADADTFSLILQEHFPQRDEENPDS
jgi:AcrR family transcriptional regulator